MLIHNPKPSLNLFKCNRIVYNYLADKVPLFSMDNDAYYFANTEKLNKVLHEAPFHIKVVIKLCKS